VSVSLPRGRVLGQPKIGLPGAQVGTSILQARGSAETRARSAREADAERARREFPRTIARRAFDGGLVSELIWRKVAAWWKDSKEEHPHSSLGYRTPKEFGAVMRAVGALRFTGSCVLSRTPGAGECRTILCAKAGAG